MALRRIECIERALQQMFHRVLQECGDADPPQLREVHAERDDRNFGIHLRAYFAVEGRPDYVATCDVSERNLMMDGDYRDLTRSMSRRGFVYDAGVLWSRMYEDHYVNRMRRAAEETAARELIQTGDSWAYEQRRQQLDELERHARAHHFRDAYQWGNVSFTTEPRHQTATEVRARQSEFDASLQDMSRRVSDAMTREIERSIVSLISQNVEPDQETTLTVETIRRATAALAQNPYHDSWRRAFRAERVAGDYMLYGSEIWHVGLDCGIAPEVGTKEAQERGLQLLRDNLSPEQRASYDKHRHFDVKGGSSGKTYRIKHGRQMNIEELDAKGGRVCGWCFLPQGGLVAGDCMLAQKTALELFEADALKIANRFN